tara:strand:+ start:771 stop:977 length:207 start_codon:yes stop_codon:yes gene_type:complete
MNNLDMETKYDKGDIITINNKDWVIENIVMRFGRALNYGLERKNKNGKRLYMNIETGSLETMMMGSDD